MSDTGSSDATLLRDDSEAFDALRDSAAERFAIDSGAVEKEYWALEVLRTAIAPLDGVDHFVFKGGTSLSKAYGIIERFSEDIDLLVVTTATGKALKRLLRTVADRTSTDLGIEHERAHEGRGFLNARYTYPARRKVRFLSPGVLLEMGSRGGPLPSRRREIQSLMADAAGWPYTPRPESGFASSPAFSGQPDITDALNSGYARLDDLVWGHRPSFAEAIDIVRTHRALI